MNRNSKKGFTIVELIIVIAVIAVLAAVLIPTFSNLIQKANEAKDTALVSDLNKGLKMSGKNFTTMHEALQAVEENVGINVAKISAAEIHSEILWDGANNCFVYLKSGATTPTYIPDSQKTNISEGESYKYWQILDKESDIPAPSAQKYSIYWNGGDLENAVTVAVGFDAGSAKVSVDYTGVTLAGKLEHPAVTIRTNGGDLTVNASADSVDHYGASDYINVKSIYAKSFHEYGVASVVRVEQGHFVAEATAKVINLNVASSDVKITETDGAKVVGYSKDNNDVTVTVNGTEKTVEEIKTAEDVKAEAANSEVIAEGGVAEVNGINYKTLSSAVDLATSGSTIVLLEDYKITSEQQFDKDLTFDLNGHVLELVYNGSDATSALTISEKTLTLVDTSSSKSGKIVSNSYGVSSEYNGTTIVDGVTIESNYACLTGNNTIGKMNFTVKSGSLISKYSEAIYMPGQGVLTITGGEIVGGISMRMGTLNMSGGTVSGLRNYQSADPISAYWGYSGSAWIGDAIYVMAGTYTGTPNNDCSIEIKGGTINGEAHNAVCVYDIGNNYAQKVTVTISSAAKITGEVKIDRNFTNSEKYNRNYPADVTITTPTETLK